MKNGIRLSESSWSDIRGALFTQDGSENGGVLLCGSAHTAGGSTLLVRHFIPVPDNQYTIRKPYQLEIAPAFYNAIISRSLRDRLSPILVHSHPHHDEAWFSPSDDRGDYRLLEVLNSLLPGLEPASLVITRASALGRHLKNGQLINLSRLSVRGQKSVDFHFMPDRRALPESSAQYDRQIRVFGKIGQQILEGMTVGIVGVGGVGSLVAEQLARAGVRSYIIIDNDDVEISNVSRLFGATLKSVDVAKVDVAANNIRDLGATDVELIRDSAIRQTVLMGLRGCDVIFSCVDNDRTRAILNRFAHQYVIPVIDLGVRLDGRGGQVKAASGRVSLVGPGMVCLRCSHHLNVERIRAESMPEEERGELQREGYIMGIDEPAPAIVSLNTVIAGLGVTAAFNMFLGITGGRQPVDQLYDAKTGTVFAVESRHDPACDVCSIDQGISGIGDLKIVSAYE